MTTTAHPTTRPLARRLATTTACLAVTAAGLAGATVADAATPRPATTTAAAGVRVTDGWSAVVLAPTGRPSATGTLHLVSPTGSQYRVLSGIAPNEGVADVAGDGRHVLLQRYSTGPSDGNTFRLVDTRTGRATAVRGTWERLGFTHPSGTALIGRVATATGSGSLVRTTLAGAPVVTFAGTSGHGEGLPSLDGTTLVSVTRTQRLQVNDNATGRVLRTLALPRGFASCWPQHFTDATRFTATCQPAGLDGPSRVYRFTTAGGAPVALTGSLATTRGTWLEFGYQDSWATPSGQVVKVVSPCGAPHLGLVRGRTPRPFTTLQDGSEALGVVGGQVFYHDQSRCDDVTSTLSRHDVATGRNTVLAGGRRNPGTWVRSAALVDRKA